LVDKGLTLSLDENGETHSYCLGGRDFEDEIFSNIEAFSVR
jgi:hypothetical protein